jgi:hypothetical protein
VQERVLLRRFLLRLRYTRLALLVFGLGLIAGFVAVVGEIPQLEKPASVIMALGLIAVPITLFADGHGFTALRWLAARWPRRSRPVVQKKAPAKPRAPGKSRAKPASPKTTKPSAARRAPKPRTRTAKRAPRRPSS